MQFRVTAATAPKRHNAALSHAQLKRDKGAALQRLEGKYMIGDHRVHALKGPF